MWEKKRTTQRVIIDVYVQIAITKLEGKSNISVVLKLKHHEKETPIK